MRAFCTFLFFCVIGTFALIADQITVSVQCSNGCAVANLPIQVFDLLGTEVPNLTTTDAQGQFIIDNSETFTQPFTMNYRARNGSSCGGQGVFVDASNEGHVFLNYYPTELPCSCANL